MLRSRHGGLFVQRRIGKLVRRGEIRRGRRCCHGCGCRHWLLHRHHGRGDRILDRSRRNWFRWDRWRWLLLLYLTRGYSFVLCWQLGQNRRHLLWTKHRQV